MFLTRAKVEGFGKLVDKEFSFKPGLNVVFGPNESGKTTLAKFLLYTLSAPSEDALRYKPWNADVFGGFVETSDGVFKFGESRESNISRTVLESVAFLLEDDDIETVVLDRNIIEGSLRKKSEKTDEGRLLKSAIQNIGKMDLKACIEELSSDLEKVETEIREMKEKITARNKLYMEKRTVESQIKQYEITLDNLRKQLSKLSEERKESLSNEINQIKRKIESLKTELAKHKWVETVDSESIQELSLVFERERNIKNQLNRLENEDSELQKNIDSKSADLEDRLKLLGATSEKDLENISLRLKHLNLLAKMYGDSIKETSVEDPLWNLFLENPAILDEAEEEEQRFQEDKTVLEQDKRSLQEQIERTENTAKYSKDLSVISAIAGIVLFVLGLLFKNISLFMYIPSALFLVISVIFIARWRKNLSLIDVLEESLVQLSIKEPQSSNIWKILRQYGISDLKLLRRKYTEFLEWKAKNIEKERQIEQLKTIEQEIIRELSKFGVNGAAQMIVSAVENLQRTFNEIQEIIYEKESMERKLMQVRGEYLSLQKELKSLTDFIEEKLREMNLGREDVDRYHELYGKYSGLKAELFDAQKRLEELEENLSVENMDATIAELKFTIAEVEKKLSESKAFYENLVEKINGLPVNLTSLNALLISRDETSLKMHLVKYLGSLVPKVYDYLQKKFDEFVDSYYKIFNEEFTRFFYNVSGQPRNFVVSPDLSIKVVVEGDLKEPSEYLSGSTKDLLIFGMKNALYKTFFDDNMPLVIDNTLIRFDDERLGRILEYLKNESNYRQIIFMTSDSRILKIYGNENINIIHLEG
ncbi:MAG TPA: AAA family ATPase [Fervidobacterium sp.]|nr:AAA family ATPase [Fervidobacterium sp.]HQE49465.1 AAA family ATPase [Fervidobacterium sp.]HUM43304.1 AAA family ATPase [Fervidobacterium sp.]